jgi:cytochrome c oxidase subunit 2
MEARVLRRDSSREALSWVAALWLTAAPVALAAEATPSRHIEVTASRYAFEPSRIEVEQGDVVDIVVHSADTDHGFAIDAYGIKVKVPKGGAPVAVSFVATRAGTFPIRCSEYCGSGHKRMKAELVVVEKAQ